MELIIEDINLVDSATSTAGKSWSGETLGEFIEELERQNKYIGIEETLSLNKINNYLVECGIEPITLEQIIIIGKV